jgi:hypothetical protein
MLPYTQKLPTCARRYRRPVPDRLKTVIGKDNLVKKLGKTYSGALAAYPKVHAEFEQIIRKAEQIVSATDAPEEQLLLIKLEFYLEGDRAGPPHGV